MNNKKLAKVISKPKTTAKWIKKQIAKTDLEDIERLCVFATSSKLTEGAFGQLYDSCKSTKLVIALAKNPVISETCWRKILSDVAFDDSYDWNIEERINILQALEQSAHAEWIEKAIGEIDFEDIECLCVFATSGKLTEGAFSQLYDSCKSTKLVIALAKNPVISETCWRKILDDVGFYDSYDWNIEERKNILQALEQTAHCIGDRLGAVAYGILLDAKGRTCDSNKRDEVSYEGATFAYSGYMEHSLLF